MSYLKVAIDANGEDVKLHYQVLGAGRPVVLIHGWPMSADMWEYQLEALINAGNQVIMYDRRGFGKSSKPWGEYNYDTLTDDLNAILTHLNVENAVLVGFSMGGGEVARYFSKYAGKGISKVVLISSILPFMLKTDDNPSGTPQEVFNGMAQQMRDDRIGFLAEFSKSFFGVSMLNHPLSDPLMKHFLAIASCGMAKATLDCATAFATTDFRSEMNSINVPTLIIHGDADNTVAMEPSSKAAAEMIPNNTFLIYEGAPHGLFYTNKERLNADLVQFIAS